MVAAGVTCCCCCCCLGVGNQLIVDRKSTRLNSSHSQISYAVFCLKKKKNDVHHAFAPQTYWNALALDLVHSASPASAADSVDSLLLSTLRHDPHSLQFSPRETLQY